MSDTWLNEARGKRHSQYSPVIIVESNDPRRVKQAMKFAVQRGFNGERSTEAVYDLSEWTGLRKLVADEEGRIEASPVESSATDFSLGGGDLKQIDAFLREGATAIIHDFVNVPKDLIAALNAWSVDGPILDSGATVIAFLPPADIPENVRLRCNAVRAPLSTPEEREEIVKVLEDKAVELKL